MSELAEALARLERAVTRLEMATGLGRHAAEEGRVAEASTAIAGRIDAALAKLARLLDES
jgi:hypothetical protein